MDTATLRYYRGLADSLNVVEPSVDSMIFSRSIRAGLLCVWLAAVLAGCASFGKCGFGDCSADAKISAEVRTLLAQSPSLGAPNQISVQTIRGVVYLRGLVSTPHQIAEAGSIAEQAAGVTDVQNMLTIDNSY